MIWIAGPDNVLVRGSVRAFARNQARNLAGQTVRKARLASLLPLAAISRAAALYRGSCFPRWGSAVPEEVAPRDS